MYRIAYHPDRAVFSGHRFAHHPISAVFSGTWYFSKKCQIALKLTRGSKPAQNVKIWLLIWKVLIINEFLGFIFSFRLTFPYTTTRKSWYRSEIVIGEFRRWTFFKMAGLAFPISTIFIFLLLSSLHLSDPTACFNFSISSLLDCQFFLNYSIFGLVGGALTFDSVHLDQWGNTELADVSVRLTQMFAIVVLKNL